MRGQALISLLFFMIIAMNVTAAAVVILVANSLSGTKFQQGSIAYQIATAGVENAKIRLLRDAQYAGETLPVGSGNAVVTITKSGSQYTIVSKGMVGNFVRQIRVIATYNNNLLSISSQQEIF
jgi:hypothetical protein